MPDDDVLSLLEKIKDAGLISLAEIACLSYPTFLRRVGGRLTLAACHHLYQFALYRTGQKRRRATYARTAPRLRQFVYPAEHLSDNAGEEE